MSAKTTKKTSKRQSKRALRNAALKAWATRRANLVAAKAA